MDRVLTVKDQVEIDAPVSKVWEVLIAPKYVRQWDDLPEDFGDYYLERGRIIEWTGRSRLTVLECEPNALLKLSFYMEKCELSPASYDINYACKLTESGAGVLLELEIGDFAALADGEDYFQASKEFAATALEKIKNLSENRL